METSITKQPLPETWEQFCEQTGRDPNALPDTYAYDEKYKLQALANFKLPLIIAHCNGAPIEPGNSDQRKYEIWWEYIVNTNRPSGFGLSYGGCVIWFTLTDCGPAFSFLEIPVLRHVAHHFVELFNDLYLM